MTRVLLVEDESQLRLVLRLNLVAAGYEVLEAGEGAAALELAGRHSVDIVVLDLGLPVLPGLEVLRRFRRFSSAPVVVLSARDRREDKVAALDLGADDYVTKPFDPHELLARLRAALRRSPPGQGQPSAWRIGDLEIDLGLRQVRRQGESIRLTRTELSLLEELAGSPGRLLTHEHLLRRIWGEQAPGVSSLRAHVKGLRRKLGDDAANPTLILSETGVGYRWIASDPAGPSSSDRDRAAPSG